MIMKQERKTEAEKSMEENKGKNFKTFLFVYILPEFGMIAAAAAGIFLLSKYFQAEEAATLRNVLFVIMAMAVTGFHLRQEHICGRLDYDNGEHILRFWICFLICLAAAFACSFLPAGGWPFVAIYVALSLFSNMAAGILSASVLLMLPVLAADGNEGIFFLYFICGSFAVTLFRHLEQEVKIGIPLFLSLLCLLLCLTAGTALTANSRLDLKMFVIPSANIILSGILLVGCLKLFSSTVVFRYRERYLELNDTANPLLAELKNSSRERYFLAVHTAYFCERIALELQLDVDALKCAGYYHSIGEDRLPALLEQKYFPPGAREILGEYLNRRLLPQKKETAVLFCSNAVMASIQQLIRQSSGQTLDFDKIIDGVFQKFRDSGFFENCDISVRELCIMQKKFKEEKLYYELLR